MALLPGDGSRLRVEGAARHVLATGFDDSTPPAAWLLTDGHQGTHSESSKAKSRASARVNVRTSPVGNQMRTPHYGLQRQHSASRQIDLRPPHQAPLDVLAPLRSARIAARTPSVTETVWPSAGPCDHDSGRVE